MRINVYSQELTKEYEVVETIADTGLVYYGLRMFLHSTDKLHHTVTDDDRSAVTIWIPESKTYSRKDFVGYLQAMTQTVCEELHIDPMIDYSQNIVQH